MARLLISYYAHFLGGYDKRLRDNVEYLEELKRLAVSEGVSGQVKFVTSCSTSERNELLSNCLCVLYTPKVHILLC
jgi:alpha-1,3/alpha-1,6-mannosyltransferase